MAEQVRALTKDNIIATALTGSILSLGTVFLVAMDSNDRSPSETAYRKYFVGDSDGNDCLKGTEYDPSENALLRSGSDNNKELTVIPASQHAELPVLHLLFEEQTYNGTTTYFLPLDHRTAGELADNNCARPLGS